ncbi:HAD superfamily hydrolase (TIGR01549 family) [Anoxybacillus tengchongensis]|uniref:HAD superfamily hydrolase (TIGR01549 family) n=1 Tax=Anoxybacillus tengchongensis TaxID=576944 RepID=A0A7W9YNE1_9BACL|nr:HAD-IA family hydrolase [Anoxybacillus tengchongensis]MBB6175199.1 HAD superfamily hydrolase (TIGR01549 family) [Anoxybacillus tengchongensis]
MAYEALMFDLDGTLVDTSAIKTWREKRLWHECIRHFRFTRFNPHVRLLLNNIQNKKIGIVTNAPYMYAEPLLKYHGIRYDALISYEKNRNNKPYPDPLFRCAQHMNVHIKHCIYVGNEAIDIAAAKAAGCTSVAYVNTYSEIEQLLVHMPHLIINNFLDLQHILTEEKEMKKTAQKRFEQALEEKHKGNGSGYFRYLREASDQGHGLAQYYLAKLLRKNPHLLHEGKNVHDLLWSAAMKMIPEAIFELGQLFEKENEWEKAKHFYRVAAHMGYAPAQYFFAKMKLRTPFSHMKLHIAYHWIKKCSEKLNQTLPLLNQVEKIVQFENDLRQHFHYDKGNEIFFICNYLPNEKYKDEYSMRILGVKERKQADIAYFCERISPLISDDIVICCFPSSDHRNILTGIREIAQFVAQEKGIDGTDCLVRWKSREKSSYGGERNIQSHVQTMKVFKREKIVGKHVLLLDDVTTSGSSLRAGEQLLLESGALYVTKLALGKTK